MIPESFVRWSPTPLRSSISAAFVKRLKIGTACAIMDSDDEKPFCNVRDLVMVMKRKSGRDRKLGGLKA